MATADQYASWIVANQSKKGTPEFETVAAAYKEARGESSAVSPTPTFQEPEIKERGYGEELGRQLGLTARYGIKGALAIPAMLGDAMGAGSSQSVENLVNMMGLPKPEGSTEKLAQGVTEAMAGGGGMTALGRGMMGAVSPAIKGIGGLLSANPAQQVALSGVSGGATEMARESGAGPVGQTLAAVGAPLAAGTIGPMVSKVAQVSRNMIAPMFSNSAAEQGAAKVMNKLSGDDAGKIASMLASGQRDSPLETAAQTLAPVVRPEISALQKVWGNRKPADFVRNLQSQEEARTAAIAQLGLDTEPARSGAMSRANQMTSAMTTAERKAADYGSQATQAVDDLRRLERARSMAQGYDIAGTPTLGSGQRPVIGTGLTQASSLAKTADKAMDAAAEASLKAGSMARVAENLVGSWESRGLKPLTADNILGHINSVKTTPTNVTNDTLRLVLNKVENSLKRATQPDGTIPVESIYTLRKTGINDLIERMSGENKDLAKRLSANELGDVKKYLDDAIEAAGGTGWKKYLKDYSEARTKIDSPLDRMEASNKMADKGMPAVNRVLNESRMTAPGLIDKTVSILNAVLRSTEGIAGENVNKAGANLMLPDNTRKLGLLMMQDARNPTMMDKIKRNASIVPRAAAMGLLTPRE